MSTRLPLLALAILLVAVAAGRAAAQEERPPAAAPASRRNAPAQPPHTVVISPPGTPAAVRPVPIISLSVKDADLVEVIRSFARIAGVNVIFDPSVSGTVTAELVNVRWDLALAAILKTHGLAAELDGRILTVATPARLIGAQ